MTKPGIPRRSLLAGGIAGSALIMAPHIARAAAPEFVLKVAHPLAASHPTNIRLKEAADLIAKDTDGRVELRRFRTASSAARWIC